MTTHDKMSPSPRNPSPNGPTTQDSTAPPPLSQDNLSQMSFQYMKDGFSVVDLDGIHVDVNPALCHMTGFTAEELIGSSPKELYWAPEERDKTQAIFAKTLQGELEQGEFIFIHKSGRRFPVIVNPFAITGPDNNIQYYAATVIDMTQQEAIKAALRDSEVRFRTLFENAGDAISIMKGSQIIDCNKQLLDLYGYPREEMTSMPPPEFFPETQPDGKKSRDLFKEKVIASRTGTPQQFEWHGEKADGTSVIVEVSMTTFALSGEFYEQAISRDITQRKQLEMALLDLNKTLENRVAQRTEDLEKACAELLQRNVQFRTLTRKLMQAEEEERRRIAQVLHDNHQQLLAAAKIKAELLAGELPGANPTEISHQIVEILAQALEGTRSLTMELAPPILYGQGLVTAMQWLGQWMEEHHQLHVEVTGSLPSTSLPRAVSSLLFRAVRELLFNVSKHSGVRQANVCVSMNNRYLEVSVSDDGLGFDLVSVLQTRSYGLFSIQEQLIPLDGQLDICSTPGNGTSSTLKIPMSAVQDLPPLASSLGDDASISASDEQPLRGAIRILVADDNAIAREALQQTLALTEGFDVVGEATNGLEAVEKARILRPDVILMDANMPLLDGLEATRRISLQFPDIKVIGHSIHAAEDMQPQMAAAGAVCYLRKPTRGEELTSTIRGVTQARRAGERQAGGD